MLDRPRRAAEQPGHLTYETSRLTGDRWWRWGSVWFTDTFWTIASYRLSRASYLLLGRGWRVARVAAAPLLFALRLSSGRCDIGDRKALDHGDIKIGDNVLPGANACVLGPLVIFDVAEGSVVLAPPGRARSPTSD